MAGLSPYLTQAQPARLSECGKSKTAYRPEVNHEIELRGAARRSIGGLCAAQDLIDLLGSMPEKVSPIRTA